MEVITKLPIWRVSFGPLLRSGSHHPECTSFHEFVFEFRVVAIIVTAAKFLIRMHYRNHLSISQKHKILSKRKRQWKQSQGNELIQGTFSPDRQKLRLNATNRASLEREKEDTSGSKQPYTTKGAPASSSISPKNSRAHAAKVYGNPYRTRYDRFIVLYWSKNFVSECQKMKACH